MLFEYSVIVKAGLGNNFNNNIEEYQFDDGTLTDADVALLIGSGIPARAANCGAPVRSCAFCLHKPVGSWHQNFQMYDT